MLGTIADFINYYNVFVLFYFLVLNFSYLFLLFLATWELLHHRLRRQVRVCHDRHPALIPSIAILIPAHDEETTIVQSILSITKINYPKLEIIVMNDGSTDGTLDVLRDAFKLFRAPHAVDMKVQTMPVKTVFRSAADDRLIVIDKDNGGKADALNVGLNFSKSRLFCALDADSIVEKDALTEIIYPYLARETKVIGLGGTIRIANDCKVENGEIVDVRVPRKLLPALQVIEYIRAFLCGRMGWSKMNSLLIISGAFGLFERKSVIRAGGYRKGIVGEDMELVVRLHRSMRDLKRPYKLIFIPTPILWTQVPDSLKVLSTQRNRWQRGLLESIIYNWKMFLNPRYGVVGMIGFPYFVFFEILGPVIELTGYLTVIISFVFGWINADFLILFFCLAVLFGVLLSLFSLLLAEFTLRRYNKPMDLVRLFCMAVIENFGYRQINSWWRVKATFDFMRRKKGWGKMERSSFG